MSEPTFGDLAPETRSLITRICQGMAEHRRATGIELSPDHFVLRMGREQWAGVLRALHGDEVGPEVAQQFLGFRAETPDDATEPELVCVWRKTL